MVVVTERFGLTELETFLKRTIPEPNSGCLLWLGTTIGSYGRMYLFNGAKERAHRYSFRIFVDKTLSSKDKVCHRCDTPLCVEPNHLFKCTDAENIKDAISKGRMSFQTRCNHPNIKLTQKEIDLIKSDNRYYKEIAKSYGISNTYVHKIKRKQ